MNWLLPEYIADALPAEAEERQRSIDELRAAREKTTATT